MGFFNECAYILRKSNKDMMVIKAYDGLKYNYFKNSEENLLCNTLTNNKLCFSNYYFDIDSSDIIYGIFNDKTLNIVNFNDSLKKYFIVNKIEYDYKNFSIDFPYIKFIDDDIHILYYLTSKTSSTTILFHHYRHNNTWFENKIDFINIPVIDNFTVFFNNNTPIIFYIGYINGFTQVLTSSFNLSTCTWSKPFKITSTDTNKIYLSVIRDHLNFYHISFSETLESRYCIKYINGYLYSNTFDLCTDQTITSSGEYTFPSLIKYNDSLYLMWVTNKILYTSISSDLGISWSDSSEDDFSMSNKFIRCFIKSNYSLDLEYNCSSLFIADSDISILGFDIK